MTDLETLRAMFDRADVRYDLSETPGTNTSRTRRPHRCWKPQERSAIRLVVVPGTSFGFDAAGTLLWVGAWE